MICEFIAGHRDRFGVAPICRALSVHGIQIAPRTFYSWAARPPSKRALSDIAITEVLASYYEPDEQGRQAPESLYGSAKMWAHLNREGIRVAKCTVERLMRRNGWHGVRRQKRVRTTVADPTADRAPDLVNRQFRVPAPNQLLVADFTYVPMAPGGFCYTAFVTDAYAGLVVGWECSTSQHTALVEAALQQARAFRSRQQHPMLASTIHHSDAGSQYTAIRFAESLLLAGIRPSIGSVADAYDNALAETTIGLYKTECIRSDSPFRHGPLNQLADLELITGAWVDWYNNHRLMHRLDRKPPAEHEASYYTHNRADEPAGHT